MIKYKEYVGSFTFDEKTNLFQGRVSNIQYPLTFQGKSLKEINQSFRDSINEHLDWCIKHGKIPEQPFPIE